MSKNRNFLDFVPAVNRGITFIPGENGADGRLEIVHESWADKLAQKLFHKPRVTVVKLERFGSFIWGTMDGERSIFEIAGAVLARFGEEAEPLYERLAGYFRMLHKNGYVSWKRS